MSGMNMKRIIHQAQNLGAAGLRHSMDNPSAVLETAVKWGRSRLDESNAPQAVAGVLDTVAGKVKLPRRTRKRVMKALKRAARELRHQSPSYQRKKKAWLLGGILLTATVGTIVLVRTLTSRGYPDAPGTCESTPATNPPASGKVPAETPAENTDSLDQPIQENEDPPTNLPSTTEPDKDGHEA